MGRAASALAAAALCAALCAAHPAHADTIDTDRVSDTVGVLLSRGAPLWDASAALDRAELRLRCPGRRGFTAHAGATAAQALARGGDPACAPEKVFAGR